MRLAVVAPVSPGRRIVGAEAGADHDQGPLARLAGCLGMPLAGCTGLLGSALLLRTALSDGLAADFCFTAGFLCATAGFSPAGAGFCSTTAGFAVRDGRLRRRGRRRILRDSWFRFGRGWLLLDDGRLVGRAGRLLLDAAGLSCVTLVRLGGAGFCSTMAGLSSVAAGFSSTAAGLSCATTGFSSAGAGFCSAMAGLSSAAGGFSSAAAAGFSCAGAEGCAAAGLGLSVAGVCASAWALITINKTQHSTPARAATAVDRTDKRMD